SLAGVPRISTGGASVHGNEVAVSGESQPFGHRHPLMVLQIMAFLTEQLQVIKAQGNLRVVDVIRRQINLVVDDLAAGAASLTQTVPVGDVCRPGSLPDFRFIEPPRPWFHMITPLGARRAPRPGVSGEPRGLGPVVIARRAR